MGRFKNSFFSMGSARLLRIIGVGVFFLVWSVVGAIDRFPSVPIAIETAHAADAPAVDYDAIEAFLKKITANQAILKLTVIRNVSPSPISGLLEVKFTFETNGQRQNGLVYLSGSKMILGQIFDLTTEQNLTAEHAGVPEPIHYDTKDMGLNDRVPRGKPGGKLVIVEFSDFQCPYCKKASGPLAELLKKYPQDVVLYYKHFPIINAHPLAYQMAMASECARSQKPEAFWSFHDRFFGNPPIRDDSQLREQIRRLVDQQGLEVKKFMACYDHREQASRIDKDMADARKIGVAATPTFLVNGEFVSGAQPMETFERYLKAK
jgi:protein-disulfide isomerase